jgi:hypothetical protein
LGRLRARLGVNGNIVAFGSHGGSVIDLETGAVRLAAASPANDSEAFFLELAPDGSFVSAHADVVEGSTDPFIADCVGVWCTLDAFLPQPLPGPCCTFTPTGFLVRDGIRSPVVAAVLDQILDGDAPTVGAYSDVPFDLTTLVPDATVSVVGPAAAIIRPATSF